MKLVMTLLVRDEADILAAHIDFHLASGVDFIIATDNLSIDGATDVLKSYEARGVMRYIAEPDDTYQQSKWVTRMARLASAAHQADWVINSDTDEFWYPNRADLKTMLACLPARAEAARVPVHDFPPVADAGYFAAVMTARRVLSRDEIGRPRADKLCHRGYADVTVLASNHDATRDNRLLIAERAPISILHFPLRSWPQFRSKVALGGAALMRPMLHALAGVQRIATLHAMLQAGTLEALYAGFVLSEAQRASGIAGGTLINDDRLHTVLTELGHA